MKPIFQKLRQIQATLRDHRKNKYISYSGALRNIFNTRHINYEMLSMDYLRKNKTSDTLFILGNGPSLNLLTPLEISKIKDANSLGISYSFLKKEIIPTYHLFSWENDFNNEWSALKTLVNNFAPYRKDYHNTVLFLLKKAIFRLAHPRLLPAFFPENPKCCIVEQNDSINIDEDRPFRDEDFRKSLFYRGTLSAALDIVSKLNYKNIVLLGVDVDKWEYFYQNMSEMKIVLEKTYELSHGVEHVKEKEMKYVGMYVKKGKCRTLEEYLYALKDYMDRINNTKIFVGFRSNFLYPKIPAYFD